MKAAQPSATSSTPSTPTSVRRHIQSGKQCTRLAMTWADRVSFVLTESLDVKRIAPWTY